MLKFTVLGLLLSNVKGLKEIVIGSAIFDETTCSNTATFSDDGPAAVGFCGGNKAFRKIHCEGRYCDDVTVECCDIKLYGGKLAQKKSDTCHWGPWSVRDGPYRNNGERAFVTGMQCSEEGYCDKVRSYYCEYDYVKFGKLESSFETSDENESFHGCSLTSSLLSYRYTGKHSDNLHGQCNKMLDFSTCPIGNSGEGCQKCGNDSVEGLEDCDTQEAGCINCQWATCGDSIVSSNAVVKSEPHHEECDNGLNNGSSEYCTPKCKIHQCNDGFLYKNEECDSLNEINSTCVDCNLQVDIGVQFFQNVLKNNKLDSGIDITWEIRSDNYRKPLGYWLQVVEIGGRVVIHPKKISTLTHSISGIAKGRRLKVQVKPFFEQEVIVDQNRQWSNSDPFTVPCNAPETTTDSPTDFMTILDLEKAEICPIWNDNSLCDSTYTIWRKTDIDDKHVIINTEESNDATWGRITSSVCDNVLDQGYKVGQTINYCVEQNYVFGVDLTAKKVCSDSIVPWVSYLEVDVSLASESGRRTPVKTLSFSVYVDGEKVQTFEDVSDEDGIFRTPITLKNTTQKIHSLKVVPTLTTFELPHTFVCMQDGIESNCETVFENVEHLNQVTFVVKDKTSRSVSGRLSFEGTAQHTRLKQDCSVFNETVCALSLETQQDICTNTDERGLYELQLPYGIKYEISVNSKHNHKFVTAANRRKIFQLVDVIKDIANVDFLNMEKRDLNLYHYGGECKNTLQGASFSISEGSCNFQLDVHLAKDAQELSQTLPPMEYTITYQKVVDPTVDQSFKSDIDEFFGGTNDNRVIDLKNSSGFVDFRYESKILVNMTNPTTDLETCPELLPILFSDSMNLVDFRVYQKYPNGQICTKFSNETKFAIFDQLGDSPRRLEIDYLETPMTVCNKTENSVDFNCTEELNYYDVNYELGEFSVMIQTGSPNFHAPYTKQLFVESAALGRKRETTEFLLVLVGQGTSGSFAQEKLVFSVPQWMPLLILRDPPGDTSFSEFSKTSAVSINLDMGIVLNGGVKNVHAKKQVLGADALTCVVTPATGLSTCKTNSIKTEVPLSGGTKGINLSTQQQISQAISFSTTDSYKTSTTGAAVGKWGDVFVVPSMNVVLDTTETISIVNCTPTYSRELTWDFEGDITANSLSFITHYDISVNEIPSIERAIEDNLKAGPNFDEVLNTTLHQALDGWKSTLQLNEDLKREAYNNPLPLGMKTNPDPVCNFNPKSSVENVGSLRGIATDSLGGFGEYGSKIGEALNSVNDVLEGGALCVPELGSPLVIRTYRRVKCSKILDAISKANCERKSYSEIREEICQKTFTNDECNSKTKFKRIDEDLNDKFQETDVTNANTIQFAGGGSVYSLYTSGSVSKSKKFTSEVTTGLSVIKKTLKDWSKAGVAISKSDVTTFGVEFSIGSDNVQTDSQSTSVGFTLSDSSFGDQLTVEVYTDPVYGTPVFKTVGGRTKCPWEANTTKREDTQVKLSQGQTRFVKNVPKDESAYIELDLISYNHIDVEPKYMTLWLVPDSNPHGLDVLYNGMPLVGGINFALEPNHVFKLTIEVRRGPVYKYDDLIFELYSTCEESLKDEKGFHRSGLASAVKMAVHFLEPCAEIEFEKDLIVNNFLVNSVASNPALGSNILPITITRSKDSVAFHRQTRLKSIEFQYRRQGTQTWLTPLVKEYNGEENKNFFFNKEKEINTEDDLGYSRLYWDTSALEDGDYEIRTRAGCTRDTGVSDLDSSYTSIVRGTIDRLPPAIFGLPMPSDKNYALGDHIAIRFDEYIDCQRPYRFKSTLSIPEIGISFSYDALLQESSFNTLTSYCKGNMVEFSLTPFANLETLMGKTAEMVVCNIADEHGNVIEDCLRWSFDIAVFDAKNSLVSSQMTIRTGNFTDGNDSSNESTIQKRKRDAISTQLQNDDTSNNIQTCLRDSEEDHSLKKVIVTEMATLMNISPNRISLTCIRKILTQSVNKMQQQGIHFEYRILPSNLDLQEISAPVAVSSLMQKVAQFENSTGDDEFLLLKHVVLNSDSMPLLVSAPSTNDSRSSKSISIIVSSLLISLTVVVCVICATFLYKLKREKASSTSSSSVSYSMSPIEVTENATPDEKTLLF